MDRGWIFRYWGRRLVKYEGKISCAQHANSPHYAAINQENIAAAFHPLQVVCCLTVRSALHLKYLYPVGGGVLIGARLA